MATATEKKSWVKWIRRIGIWGFLFFLAKGLLWLALAYWIMK
ncbi:alanyl-tRNA synthetase [Chitinophaga sp.]